MGVREGEARGALQGPCWIVESEAGASAARRWGGASVVNDIAGN